MTGHTGNRLQSKLSSTKKAIPIMSLQSPGILIPCLELRNALARHILSSTPRDRDLLQQVVGAGGTEQGYLYGGFVTATGIRAALRAIGRETYQFSSILDFGCGSARVLRWFQDIQPAGRLYGCDINSEAIQWCVANAAFAEFTNSAPLPPLPYADRSFDLIFGISVFTHLDERYQLAWLSELRRIVKPGGVVMMTVHGSDKAAGDLSPEDYNAFETSGFQYKEATDRTSTKGLPDFYQVAYHSKEYIERVWSEFFDIAAYIKHGCMYSQDLVAMQTRSPSTEQRFSENQETLTADLPIANLDEPVAGAWLLEEQIRVEGWAFYLSGDKLELDIGIDEQIVQRCSCNLERPSVADHFSNPGVLRSGFEAMIPAEGLGKGWHTLWISLRDKSLFRYVRLTSTFRALIRSRTFEIYLAAWRCINTRFANCVKGLRILNVTPLHTKSKSVICGKTLRFRSVKLRSMRVRRGNWVMLFVRGKRGLRGWKLKLPTARPPWNGASTRLRNSVRRSSPLKWSFKKPPQR